MLIRAYGINWNPQSVDWGSVGAGNRGKLKGKVKLDGSAYEVDFWMARGVYLLLDHFRPVYVGKAFGSRMGPRLRDHLTDRFAGRWDMFSWFTLSTVNKTTLNVRDPGTRKLSPATINDTLEALAILIAEPPLNRKRESIPDAVEAEQVSTPHPRSYRSYLEEILSRLDD